jgi:hypothetical protein
MGLSWQQGPLSPGATGRSEADIVSVQLNGIPLRLEPGQSVIAHRPNRDLTVGQVLPAASGAG